MKDTVRMRYTQWSPLALNEDRKLDVLLSVVGNLQASTHTFVVNNDAARSSVQKLLKRKKCYPYKMTVVQQILEDGYDRRVQFR